MGRGIVTQRILWSIGSRDGRSPDLLDTYKTPELLGDVVWTVGGERQQRWPTLHPSEADPEAGYRAHPYTIEFALDQEPSGTYSLCIHYLAIAARLASIQIEVNGVCGWAFLRPSPSISGEITLLPGLHTSIYAEGDVEVLIPAHLLCIGTNRLVLTAIDGGEIVRVEPIERVRRLDRMANGAGFVYQQITFGHLDRAPESVRVGFRPSVLYRRDDAGTLLERCTLYLEFSGSVLSQTFQLELRGSNGGIGSQSIQVPDTAFGHQRFSIDVPDGDGPIAYSLHAGETVIAEGEAARCRQWTVYITPHSHTDIGYTHRQWEVAERLCRNIDRALDALTDGMQDAFRYHIDSSWVLDTWLATRTAGRQEQLFEQIRQGNIGVPAAYVDLLTQTAALEDLIRNQEPAERVLRPLGLRADFTTVVDVASLSGSLPALLEGAGVRYLAHADNQDRGPFRLNGGLNRRSPYYWEGTTGGRVLVWLAKMYCELRKVCGSPPTIDSAERGLDLWLQEYEHPEYVPDTVMLYGQEADNTDLDFGPEEFVRRWNETYAYPRLVPSAVGDFFRDVENRFADSFPTVRGDGGAYWEDGALSDIRLTALSRQTQADLPAAEVLESLAVLHDDDRAFPVDLFDEAWQQLLLWDEHTWGAFLSVTDPDALLQRDQWAVKEGMARNASLAASRLLHSAAIEHSLQWNTEGREVVVYNPHAWCVTDTATVEIGGEERLRDARGGQEIPHRVLSATASQQAIEFLVEDLPGLSYRRYPLSPWTDVDAVETGGVPASHAPSGGTILLESERYRVEVDLAAGCVRSWFDLQLERELVEASHPYGFGRFLYARGGEGTRLVSNRFDLPAGNPEILDTFDLVDVTTGSDALGQWVRVTGAVPAGRLEITWSLPRDGAHLAVRYLYRKDEVRAKEAAYIDFPLALSSDARVLSDSQLGWVDWDRDELPGGCKEWLPLQTGILVRDDIDVHICSPDVPLFCVGDVVRGRWPREMRLTGGRVLPYVLNNYWHTNYRGAQGGEIEWRFRLSSDRVVPFDRAFRAGWEARRRPYAHRISFQDFREERFPYRSPVGGALATVSPETVALRTLRPARWEDGWIVHLQEIGGEDRVARLALSGLEIVRAWRCDLLEHDLEPLSIDQDGALKIRLVKWGIAAARIEVRRAR